MLEATIQMRWDTRKKGGKVERGEGCARIKDAWSMNNPQQKKEVWEQKQNLKRLTYSQGKTTLCEKSYGLPGFQAMGL